MITRSKYFPTQNAAEQFLTDRGFARIDARFSRWGWINPETAVQADVRFNSKGYFINFGI